MRKRSNRDKERWKQRDRDREIEADTKKTQRHNKDRQGYRHREKKIEAYRERGRKTEGKREAVAERQMEASTHGATFFPLPCSFDLSLRQTEHSGNRKMIAFSPGHSSSSHKRPHGQPGCSSPTQAHMGPPGGQMGSVLSTPTSA